MVSRATDASKVALAHLVARLRAGGFTLLDCQFMTDHLASLGAVEVSRAAYMALLDAAVSAAGVAGDSAASGDLGALDAEGRLTVTGRKAAPALKVSGARNRAIKLIKPP
mgnify:CR=1 FL=1